MEKREKMSKLYIIPTPIGNLEDMTLRGIRILSEVDLIACEDTRTSGILLHHYNIKTPKISYHKHNERERSKELISRLKAGEKIGLISDAGMPGISDPGEILIKKCQEEKIPVEVLPGPSAVLTAVVGSGCTNGKYYFYGFLPHKEGDKKKVLEELESFWDPIVFYESPHRLEKTLSLLYEVLGNRNIVIGRELTKVHEEYIRGRLSEFVAGEISYYPKGEFVLIIEGKEKEEREINIQEELLRKINLGMKKSQAVKEVAKEFQLPKNNVYEESLKL
ncbi:MAG: 16S rRNA (cytidine(1402)-2'-O)-methyltransferase [Tissierellia bacterium]|nr:16S rRNA (cytidine(1402)-2'-O)-methyltransferase [Tissierellia bacterium]